MNFNSYAILVIMGALCAGACLAGDSAPAAPVAAPAAAAPSTLPLISQETLLAREARHDAALFVLDVRTTEEFARGHVPGAVNIPHDQVESRLAEVPKDKDVVLYCHSGRRAGLAADVLKANGYSRLSHLDGDMVAWTAQNRPVQVSAP